MESTHCILTQQNFTYILKCLNFTRFRWLFERGSNLLWWQNNNKGAWKGVISAAIFEFYQLKSYHIFSKYFGDLCKYTFRKSHYMDKWGKISYFLQWFWLWNVCITSNALLRLGIDDKTIWRHTTNQCKADGQTNRKNLVFLAFQIAMDVHERSSTAPIFKDSYSSLVFIKSDCVTSLSRKHVNRTSCWYWMYREGQCHEIIMSSCKK